MEEGDSVVSHQVMTETGYPAFMYIGKYTQWNLHNKDTIRTTVDCPVGGGVLIPEVYNYMYTCRVSFRGGGHLPPLARVSPPPPPWKLG